jgi:hypothetical protein
LIVEDLPVSTSLTKRPQCAFLANQETDLFFSKTICNAVLNDVESLGKQMERNHQSCKFLTNHSRTRPESEGREYKTPRQLPKPFFKEKGLVGICR